MASGSSSYAMLNNLLFDSCSFWSGKDLTIVKRQMDRTCRLAKQHSVVILVQLLPLYGSLSRMLGTTNVSPSSGTEKIGEEHRIDNPFQARPYYFNMMYTAFIFRNYDHMKKSFKEYLKVKNPITSIYYAASVQTFYEGKICLFRVFELISLLLISNFLVLYSYSRRYRTGLFLARAQGERYVMGGKGKTSHTRIGTFSQT